MPILETSIFNRPTTALRLATTPFQKSASSSIGFGKLANYPSRKSPIHERRTMNVLRAGGFTLIELLVAVAVAAILASMAIVSLNTGGYDEQLRDEARRLLQLSRIAADDAIFKTSEYGVRFTHSGYTFYRLEKAPEAGHKSGHKSGHTQGEEVKMVRRWLAIAKQPRPLRSRAWPDDIEVDVFVEGLPIALDEERDAEAEAENDDLRPHMLFLSNGETIPNVEIQLSSTESAKVWQIAINEDGLLALGPLE